MRPVRSSPAPATASVRPSNAGVPPNRPPPPPPAQYSPRERSLLRSLRGSRSRPWSSTQPSSRSGTVPVRELGCVDDHGRDRLPRSDRSKLLSLGEYCAGGGGGGLFGGTPALEGRTLAVAGAGDDRTGRIGHDEPRRFTP